ncbi:MAG: rhodanese-like domain-containing protein [Ascidiaceihabitans sp.]|nr:rhodanese-like domain-containing protein [Ascidiaceihabitans sp.]
MQTSKSYMEAANAAVPRIPADEAVTRHANPTAVFVDVRDSAAIAATGTIKGAQRIPRGMLEFMADPATAAHNRALTKDAEVYLVCAAGGQAALAGKTLLDMGYTNVTNIGGIGDWVKAGGPVEEA